MRRRLIHTGLWLSGLGLCCLAYAALIEPERLVIREHSFVASAYTGPPVRIALVTDLHINSPSVPPARIARIVARLNALEPDIIVIPGDFIAGHTPRAQRSDRFNRNIETGLSYLSDLRAPVFATIGNHDDWYDAAHVAQLLEAAGVTVLQNRAEVVNALCFVGLADAMTAEPDRKAYDDCAGAALPLVITHSPDAWRSFRSDTVLALAGHTHGGQVNLPVIGRRVNAMSLGAEHSYGFSKIGGVDMFVSAGIGTSILPIRFRAPPESVVITLQAPD